MAVGVSSTPNKTTSETDGDIFEVENKTMRNELQAATAEKQTSR
jgi:hypothetical protein